MALGMYVASCGVTDREHLASVLFVYCHLVI
jgi:hypothetical protein